MKDDLISRQAAIDALRMDIDIIPFAKAREYARAVIETIHNRLEELPSVQPERKMGKWISTDDGWDSEYFVCSVCGCPWTLIEGSPEDNGMNFCPNCGAYMRGEMDG